MPKRQLAAILFSDLVGYTELMGKDSDRAMEVVKISVPWKNYKKTPANIYQTSY